MKLLEVFGGTGSPFCDRVTIWQQILKKIFIPTEKDSEGDKLATAIGNRSKSNWKGLAVGDFELLASFAVQGTNSINKIPIEWKEIYWAIYDESKSFPIADSQITSIGKDVSRTFGLFSRNLPHFRSRLEGNMDRYCASLSSLLLASSHERNYCQGENFLAAHFLLSENDERDAFAMLNYVLKQRYLEVLFNPKCSSLMEYMKLFEKRLRKHNKVIYDYFKQIGYATVCYAIEWFTTCFIVTSPGALSSCVIDLIVCGFEDVMIRVGLAVIDVLQTKILESSVEVLQEGFRNMIASVDIVSVLYVALTMPLEARPNALQRMYLNMDYLAPNKELMHTLRAHIAEEPEPQTANPAMSRPDLQQVFEEDIASTDNSTGSQSAVDQGNNTGSNGQYILVNSPKAKLSNSKLSHGYLRAQKSNTRDGSKSFFRRRAIVKTIRQRRSKRTISEWIYAVFHEIGDGSSQASASACYRPILGSLPFKMPARSVHAMLDSDAEGEELRYTLQSPIISELIATNRPKFEDNSNIMFPLMWKLINPIASAINTIGSKDTPTDVSDPANDTNRAATYARQSYAEIDNADSWSDEARNQDPMSDDLENGSDARDVIDCSIQLPTYKSKWSGKDKVVDALESIHIVHDHCCDSKAEEIKPGTPIPVHDALDSLEWCNNMVKHRKIKKILRKILVRSKYNHISLPNDLVSSCPRSWNDMYVSSLSSDENSRTASTKRASQNSAYCSLDALTKKKMTKAETAAASAAATAAAMREVDSSKKSTTSLAQSIKPTPMTEAGELEKKKLSSAWKALGFIPDPHGKASKAFVEKALVDAAANASGDVARFDNAVIDNKIDQNQKGIKQTDWLTTAVHTSLWIGSFGMVSRTVPGKSLFLREDDLSDDDRKR